MVWPGRAVETGGIERFARIGRQIPKKQRLSGSLVGQDRVSGKAPPGERGALRYLLAVVPGEPF
jgi:hypothetical protein